MFDFEISYFFYKLSKIYRVFNVRGDSDNAAGKKHAGKYKADAFYLAAMSLDAYGHNVEKYYHEDRLEEIPNIGRGSAKRIAEIIETGHLTESDELEDRYHIEDYTLLLQQELKDSLIGRLFGLGIRTGDQLVHFYNDQDSEDRKKAALIFSATEKKQIEEFIEVYQRNKGKYLLSYGRCYAGELRDILLMLGFKKVCIIGDVNDAAEKISAVDLIYQSGNMDAFVSMMNSQNRYHISDYTDRECSGITAFGIPFIIRKKKRNERIPIDYWADSLKNIRGDLHMHSEDSDGKNTVEEIAVAAERRGYEYQAITDHSISEHTANGMSLNLALSQIQQIHEYNKSHDFKLISGVEVDILSDGSLDYSDDVLAEYDVVVAAIHNAGSWGQSAEKMHDRLEKALSNPNVNILAHPTGRLLGRPGCLFSERSSYAVDIDDLIAMCSKYDVALELNCFPERLDIPAAYIQKAVSAGVKISLGTDSHSVFHMSNIEYGAAILRKLGIPEDMVLNTYSYNELISYFSKKKPERKDIRSLKKDFNYYFGNNPDIISGKSTVIGIDLTGEEDKPSGWSYLKGRVSECCRVKTDDELIQLSRAYKPDVISIDSPLSYPRNYLGIPTSNEDVYSSSNNKIMRECEVQLRHFGITVYPCLIDSMVNLTNRGMHLAQRLRDEGFIVIESYPGVAQDILGIPRKGKSKEQFHHTRRGLECFGITGDLKDKEDLVHDEADAVTSALVGYFYMNHQYVGLGNKDEDYLIVPRIQEELINRQIVVGLCGETAAGKTISGQYLRFKYGITYFRYSQVIRQMYHVDNKEELQEIGHQIASDDAKQRELSEYIISHMSSDKSYVIDGLRHPQDYEMLREKLGGNFILIYIDSSFNNRFKRYSELHDGIDRDRFQKMDEHPSEEDIPLLRNEADYVIKNNGGYETLRKHLDEIIEQKAGNR